MEVVSNFLSPFSSLPGQQYPGNHLSSGSAMTSSEKMHFNSISNQSHFQPLNCWDYANDSPSIQPYAPHGSSFPSYYPSPVTLSTKPMDYLQSPKSFNHDQFQNAINNSFQMHRSLSDFHHYGDAFPSTPSALQGMTPSVTASEMFSSVAQMPRFDLSAYSNEVKQNGKYQFSFLFALLLVIAF